MFNVITHDREVKSHDMNCFVIRNESNLYTIQAHGKHIMATEVSPYKHMANR